jgi:hypothetical protein
MRKLTRHMSLTAAKWAWTDENKMHFTHQYISSPVQRISRHPCRALANSAASGHSGTKQQNLFSKSCRIWFVYPTYFSHETEYNLHKFVNYTGKPQSQVNNLIIKNRYVNLPIKYILTATNNFLHVSDIPKLFKYCPQYCKQSWN